MATVPSQQPDEIGTLAAWVGDDPFSSTLKALASLKFTVVLFAASIFLILVGTLAQVEDDIWLVIDQYFRCAIAWVDWKVFFPKSFFPELEKPPLTGQFPFPGGWLIGGLMAVNLAAAHLIRFKKQAKGTRLAIGTVVIGVGFAATWLVVVSGMSADGFQAATTLNYGQIWQLMLFTIAAAVAGLLYGSMRVEKGSLEQWSMCIGAAVLVFSLVAFAMQDRSGQFDDSSLRILWQLMKATFASVILLVGCILVFKKRAGIVLLHGGIGLMMLSELLTGTYAVESQMRLSEGESKNYVYDIREVELAVIDSTDPDEDRVIAIPRSMLMAGQKGEPARISAKDLPFDIEVLDYMVNSDLRPAKSDDKNIASAGTGLQYIAERTKNVSGIGSETDIPSAYLRFRDRESDEVIDTLLVSLFMSERDLMMNRPDRAEVLMAGDQPWDIYLRFKRTYKPYKISLKDVRKEDYVGTSTPKDYSSYVRLVSIDVDRDVRIWMNNPLRFAGETFYQSGYNLDERTGEEITTLAVVKNTGWMIPYVSCMIVMVGMLAQFVITLFRFLNRRQKVASKSVKAKVAKINVAAHSVQNPKKQATDVMPPLDTPQESTVKYVTVPVLIVASMTLWMASKARTPSPSKTKDFDLYAFGQLPIAYEGRVKPIDTLARNTLRIISDREEYKEEKDNGDTIKQSAVEWMLDLVARPDVARQKRIFRVEDLELLSTLGLERRDGFKYSYDEIMQKEEELVKQTELARKARKEERLNRYTRKVLELEQHIGAMRMLETAFHRSDISEDTPHSGLIDSFRKMELLEGRQIPLVALSKDDENVASWQPFYNQATGTALRKLAEKRGLKTADELAEFMIANLPRESVTSTFKGLVPMMQEECRAKDMTYRELGMEMMGRLNSDPYLTQIVAIVMNAPTGTDADKILATLSAERIQDLFRPRVQSTFMEMARFLPRKILEPIAKDLPDDTPTPEMILNLLQRMTAGAITEIAGAEGLDADGNASATGISGALQAWKEQKPSAFNAKVQEYRRFLDSDEAPAETFAAATRFESFYNNFAPCFYPAFSYLFALVLGLAAFLFLPKVLNRSAFWLIAATFLFHTFALGARMWISGRPPVTNLYSSAVFIGWGGVILGLLFERIYRMGIGNIIAAVSGSSTLAIAHLLAGDGDTMKQLQAVLDTQFWLSTHVVTVTLGYTATFVAGLLGLIYILRGTFDRSVSQEYLREIARMTYGTVCFAILLSFVGTVLGGLWADDSWGRFWGWDPKENGALIIVIWNALVLHARWGAMVRERGMAVLAVIGNIWTAWSWFGVNELGVGLHSYGFTDGVLFALSLFVASQLGIAFLGIIMPTRRPTSTA